MFGKTLKKLTELNSLAEKIKQMRITKSIIDMDIAIIRNSMLSHFALIEEIDIYNVLKPNIDLEDIEQEKIQMKQEDLINMARVTIPKKAEEIMQGVDENDKYDRIKRLAELEAELEMYVYREKGEIEKLNNEVKEIGQEEKKVETRKEQLDRINTIREKYRVFAKYLRGEDRNKITKEYLKELYKIKLDILTVGINEQEESPIKGIEDEEEKQYYQEIVNDKISHLGENKEFKRAFGDNHKSEVLSIIRRRNRETHTEPELL